MEARNDDSPGSDYSLDKSLQKKCVVDDLGGQGEGVMQPQETCSSNASAAPGAIVKTGTEHNSEFLLNTALTHKTEKNVGEGGGGGSGGGCSINAFSDSLLANENSHGNCINFDSLNDSAGLAAAQNAQNMTTTTTAYDSNATHNADAVVNATTASIDSAHNTHTVAAKCSTEPASCTINNSNTESNTNNNNNAFETKVKQISQNLKETTLAEPDHAKGTPDVNINESTESNVAAVGGCGATLSSSSSACSSSSSSSNSSLEYEPAASNSSNSTQAETSSQNLEMNTSLQSMASESNEDQRSKKVRFHPDVKENDGGNRVIPKKKKKLKNNAGGVGEEVLASTSAAAAAAAAASSAQRSTSDDDMDMDEEDESTAEEEEDFDLAKTIAEAEDYLKTHPLTFARAQDKTNERLRNGLLDEEDLPELEESPDEDEDFYDKIPAENGVERILGKQTKAGKVEFLLRYAERPGLHWESEEVISKTCPNLLLSYDLCRERLQERLMGHVAKRQNIRQRYTDF